MEQASAKNDSMRAGVQMAIALPGLHFATKINCLALLFLGCHPERSSGCYPERSEGSGFFGWLVSRYGRT
jgi:hypothetical protein